MRFSHIGHVFGVFCTLASCSSLQYSAMWSLDTAEDMHGWATMTFEVGNLTLIQQNYAAVGITALFPFNVSDTACLKRAYSVPHFELCLCISFSGVQGWKMARPKKCFAPVKHQQTSPDGTFSCLMLDPHYVANWKATWMQIKPLVDDGALIGIFLGDEQLYFGMQLGKSLQTRLVSAY